MGSYSSTTKGLALINQTRNERNWKVDSDEPLTIISQHVDPDGSWDPPDSYAEGFSPVTWKRFVSGIGIRPDAYKMFCWVLDLDWRDVVDFKKSKIKWTEVADHSAIKIDWGNAPDLKMFFGREDDINDLETLILQDEAKVVAVYGVGAIGKTNLAIALTQNIISGENKIGKNPFPYVIWRSLLNPKKLNDLLDDMIEVISSSPQADSDTRWEDKLDLFLQQLTQNPCLIVLDNLESILKGTSSNKTFKQGYENYGIFLRKIGEATHPSCLLLTSREKPEELDSLELKKFPVRSKSLYGLSVDAGKQIFNEIDKDTDKDSFTATELEWENLINYYGGNPLALDLSARLIQNLYHGNLSTFLEIGTRTDLSDFSDLLEWHFNRLSEQSKDKQSKNILHILYWIASNRQLVTFINLLEDMVPAALASPQSEFLALKRQIPLEQKTVGETTYFTLQPVLMDFFCSKLAETIAEELKTRKIKHFDTHALIKATAEDFIRESQITAIVEPLIEHLGSFYGNTQKIIDNLTSTIELTRENFQLSSGYAAGNIINIMTHLKSSIDGYNFSGLSIRQAYLQGISAKSTNFSRAHFSNTLFTQAFGEVLSVAYSPDGNYICAGDTNSEIRVWRTSDFQMVSVCKGHVDWVRTVAFSPDSKTIASGSADHLIMIWDVQSGQCLKRLEGHGERVWSVQFSPDGNTLASGGVDQTVRLWCIKTTECLQSFTDHSGWIYSVRFSPDGNTLASTGADRTIMLWDLVSGHPPQVLSGHEKSIWALSFSPDNTFLASTSFDGRVNLWNIRTGTYETLVSDPNAPMLSLAFSPDSKTLASGSENSTIQLWNTETKQCLRTLKQHSDKVWAVCFSQDGKTLVSGSGDRSIRFWRVGSGELLRTLQGYSNWSWSAVFSPDSKTLASGSEDGIVRLWDLDDCTCCKEFKGHTGRIWSVAFSPDGQLVASCSTDHTARIWHVETGKCLHILAGHTDWVQSVSFSPDGKTLASGSEDKTIKLWGTTTGKCLTTLEGHDNWIWSVAFSPDGQTLVSGSEDRTIRIWDMTTYQQIKQLKGHTGRIWSVCFSFDGKYVVSSGSEDRTTRIWNVETGRCMNILSGHDNRNLSVACHPHKLLVATGGDDCKINLWDIETGEQLPSLCEQTHYIWSVSYSPNGELLSGSSQDGSICTWKLKTGQCTHILKIRRPYEDMKLENSTGLTKAQESQLRALGAGE